MERYDVFISFRGIDTRRSFVDFLYHYLVDSGINAFIDSKELEAGEEISVALVNAIRGSRVSVVVFSPNYADSGWCLDELVEIMECHKTMGQIVMPVFMDVYPTDVRNQIGRFGKGFAQLLKKKSDPYKLIRWKSALREASTMVGWDSEHHKHQGLLATKIVRKISNVLRDEWHLYVAEFAVGLDTRVLDLKSKLRLNTLDSVQFIGIEGMGGIGKTTVAKMLYNKLVHQFKGASFLSNVRTHSQQPRGLLTLQKQLLKDICKTRGIEQNITHIDDGINMIKNRLSKKKVLIFLDDVSDKEQLRVLAGGRDWFGPGSRVVLTTRDKGLLKFVKVDKTYKPQTLNDAESLKLFSQHAFEKNSPDQEFVQKSLEIVGYCKGVPLALVLLGQALKDKKEKKYWDSFVRMLKTIPNSEIQKMIEISYEQLGHDTLKGLFLDIAFFFIGCDKDYAIAILEDSGLLPETGMEILCSRGLVEVDEKNQLKMHDLICSMGKEVVRKTFPNDAGKRSRLWCYSDVKSILRSNLGTREIEGIALDSLEVLKVESGSFKKMKRLRLLSVNNLDVKGTYGLLSKELRWIQWHNFSNDSFPQDLYMEEVVAIDMQYSNLKVFEYHKKELWKLRFLNLSYSKRLTKIPNFLNLPHLEELILEDCIKLISIGDSIGDLRKLVLANFKGCENLMEIPDSISKLQSLKILNISGCMKIYKLPENLAQMESLMELIADGSALTYLPPSIEHLKILTRLSLCGCKISNSDSFSSVYWSSWLSTVLNKKVSQFIWSWLLTSRIFKSSYLQVLSLYGLSGLKVLKLMDCGLSNNTTLNSIFTLLSLEELDLRKNNFSVLPADIINLKKLKVLLLDDCEYLECLPDIPASLFTLTAMNCTSLKRLSVTKFEPETQLLLSNCHKLIEILGLDNQESGGNIHLEQCNNLTYDFKYFLLKNWCGRGHTNVFLPGSEIPEWFDCWKMGSEVDCKIPLLSQGRRPTSFTVCVIFAANKDNTETQPFPLVNIEGLSVPHSIESYKNISDLPHDHMWVFHLPGSVVERFQWMKKMKLSVQFGFGWTVKRVGVYFYF